MMNPSTAYSMNKLSQTQDKTWFQSPSENDFGSLLPPKQKQTQHSPSSQIEESDVKKKAITSKKHAKQYTDGVESPEASGYTIPDKSSVLLEMTFDEEVSSNDSRSDKQAITKCPRRTAPLIPYEWFISVIHYTLCLIVILDRFYWNVWPRQTFQIGTGSAGSDRMDGLKPGPWSVALYDVLARTSGRYSILAYNFLLLTRMESIEWFFAETFIAKYLLDCRNIVNANLRMHRWNGIALCVMTLLHVWSILFPCICHGYQPLLVPGQFEWPLSERTPRRCSEDEDPKEDGCWPGDTDPEKKTMGLQVDDVFRMVEMTVFLAILMPISVRWLANRWHAAIHLHRFIHIVYFVDIVRRHSHPHSWILNTPVFVLFYLDKWIFSFFHKRNNKPQIKRVKISPDFMVLFWKNPFLGKTDTVGPDYALRLHGTSIFEDKHVFTCFENRAGIALNDDDDKNHFDWDVGVVIRVFRNRRTPRLMGEKMSHTSRMYEEGNDHDNNDDDNGLKMLITGPRQGEMSESVKFALLQERVVLIGAGSAINYLLDCLQWCCADVVGNCPLFPVKIVYSTRDRALFHWCYEAIVNLLRECKCGSFDVTMALTGEHQDTDTENRKQEQSCSIEGTTEQYKFFRTINVVTNRLAFDKIISSSTTVFCQGSGSLKDAVNRVCRNKKAVYYGGLGGGS